MQFLWVPRCVPELSVHLCTVPNQLLAPVRLQQMCRQARSRNPADGEILCGAVAWAYRTLRLLHQRMKLRKLFDVPPHDFLLDWRQGLEAFLTCVEDGLPHELLKAACTDEIGGALLVMVPLNTEVQSW
jgi:hypothetical protein